MNGKTGRFIRTLSAVMAAVLLLQFAFPALAESLPETVQTTKAPAAYTTSRIVIELDRTGRMSAQEAETAIGSIIGSAAFSAREELIPGRYICVDIGDCAKMPETLMRLNASDAVAGASADGVMHTCAGNGDPDAALPSALITPANALVDQPAGITVGLLDTGVDAGDSALTGRLDQENARSFAADGDTAHGTNAARILALANGVTILPLTVVDGNTGTCQLSAVIQAIGYAMEKGVGLLNCSFCFDEYNTPLKDLMEDSGILFVAAVGNGGDGKKSYPAAYGLRNVIAVGSVDADNRTADNVSGNSVTVYTTPRAESDAETGGNSFAAATVTATVALMRQAAPILDDAMIQQALAKADPTADGVKTLDPSACVTYVLPYACLQDGNVQKLAALDGKGLNAASAAVLQRHPTAEGLTETEWTTLREHFELSAGTVQILRETAAENAGAALPLIPLLYAGLTADRQGVTVRCFLPTLPTQTADTIDAIEETGSALDALGVSSADAAVMAELTESGHTLSALLGAYLVTRITGGDLRTAVRAADETTDAYSDDVRAAVEAYSVSGSYIGSWFARESSGFSALRAAVARYTAQRGVTYADGALTLSNAAADRMELYARYPFANAGSWPVGEFSVNKLTGEAGYSQTLTSFLNALPELTLTYDPQAADILSDVGPAADPSAVTYYVSDGRQAYRAIDAGELPYYLTADCRLTAAEAVGAPAANFYERLYGLGAGWRLNIPAIETDGLILHGSDGSKTAMTDNGDGTYTLYGRLPDTYSLTAVSPAAADGTAFCYTDLSRDRYFFDASGRFLKKENEYGRTLTASYDSLGRLSALTEGNRSLQFVRTVSGSTEDVAVMLVSGAQSSCLAHIRKTKDGTTGAYLLTSVSDAVGDTTSFGYDKQTCAVLTNYCSAVTEAGAHTAVTAYLTQVTTPLGAVHTLSCEKAVKAYGAAGERDYYRAESVCVNGELLSSFGYRMGYSPFFPEVSRFTPTDTLCFSRVNNNRLDARTWTLSDGRCAYAGVNVMESEEYREYICFDGFTGRELGTAVYHEDTPAERTETEAWDCRGNAIRTRSYLYVGGTQAAQQVESARCDRYGNPLFRGVDLLYTAPSGVSIRLPQSYTRYVYDYSRSLTTPVETLTYTGTDEKQNTLLSSTVNQIERVTIGGRTVEQVAKTEKYKQDRINGMPQRILQSASAYTYDALGRMTAENRTALKNEKTYAEALAAGTAPDAAESYTQTHTAYVYDDYDDPVKTTVTGIHAADGSVYRLVTEQEYDFRGLLTLTKPAYRTDDAGNVLDSYAGSISGTAYTYNGRGECIRTEKPDGTVEETVIENRLPDGEKDIAGSPYAGILNRVTTRSSGEPDAITLKDSRGRTVATKKKMAGGTEITLTESEYDAHDRLLTQTEYTKNDCTEYTVTTYAYDWQGREISSVSESFGEDGQQTVTGTQTVYGAAVVSENAYETVTVTDELSGVSTTSYTDGAERTVLTVTATDGRTVNEFGVFGAYGEVLRQCGDTAMSTESKADADGKETTQVFGTGDNATVQESQHDGNGAVVAGGTKKSKSYSVYDELGQEIRVETDLALDADGNPVRSVTEYTYDGLGRRIRQRTLADGDGDSAVWAVTEYGYDALGRLIWVDEQESADVHHVTRYAYDAAGRKIAQREGLSAQPLDNSPESLYSEAEGGRLTVYTYDEDGRFTSITTPDGGTERYTYDDAGRMTEKVLANGRRMTYVYDVAGRLVSMTGIGTSGSVTHVTTYDAQGRVRDKQDENGATRYAYDQDGNILAESRIEGGKLISQNRYTYTVDGRQERYRLFICALTVPASPADGWELSAVDAAYAADVSLLRQDIAYTYDNQARLVCAEDGVSGSVTRYTYDSEGALAEKRAAQRTNGVETPIYRQEYTYNLAGLITGIREFAGSDTAPCKVDTLTYRRDGNLVRKVSGDTTVEYAYDALGRLAAETEFSIGTQVRRDVYTYTAAGDRRTKTTTTGEDGTQRVSYGYDAGGRLISEDWAQKGAGESYDPLSEKAVTYTYDASGNLLTKTVGSGDDRVCVAAYTYDSLNRLSGAVSASVREMPDLMDAGGVTLQQVKTQTVAFRYDANAQRIGKTVTLGYAADGEDAALTAEVRHVVNDTAAAYDLITQDGATRESSYLFGTKGADGAAQFEALYTGDTLYAAVSDAHTDVVGLRTVSGTTVEYAYDAFGNELSAAETALYNPYRYVGQYYDSETGLYYLRARYYDPETGRFTQRDSYQGEVNNPQSLNLYAYATNNPVRFLDRFGHMNYLTQTGTLFRGILSGVISEIAGLFNIQGYIDMAKAIFSGQLNLKTLFAGLADNHYVYVLMHLWVLNPFKGASNKDVTEMGKHIGGIVYDIAAAMVGAAAAKVLSVLKTTKIGSKIASTLSKAKIKVASTAKNVAARAKAAAKDIRSAFKRGALKKVGHHLFPKYLGGLPKQRLAKMYAWTHRRLHSDLSKFEGGWLYPKRRYTGLNIRELYTKQTIIDGLTKFYSQPQYSHLLEDFLKEAMKQ